MTDTAFGFLSEEWPEVHDAADRAYRSVNSDPRVACFYARRALELAVMWAYDNDGSLHRPYDDKLSALIHEPTFKHGAGEAVFAKARLINRLGNRAVHDERDVPPGDGRTAVGELAHVCHWLARTYARTSFRSGRITLDFDAVPAAAPSGQSAEDLAALEARLEALDKEAARLRDEAERQRVRAEIAEAKARNEAQPDDYDYSEDQTRSAYIDLLLREAGWDPAAPNVREYEVAGMPTDTGVGYVDYVLWGDDGLPLAVVEAKRVMRSAREGQEQAKLYADCLEAQFGQRPVIFGTNGYEHWIWDDTQYPPRPISGFLTKDELQLRINRRATRARIADATVDAAIAGRPYQQRAILRVTQSFEVDNRRKALLVMATGTGKTRVAVALSDLLMRANWAKRVLFLADRRELVKQAKKAFAELLPDTTVANLLDDRHGDARVCTSTYPTMMGLIDDMDDGRRRYGVGHFDLIVIDEAHRSVFQKYRAIFEYFDSLLLGLTATPAEQVDRNTYDLFDLEPGVPTDAYDLDAAVREGYLVAPVGISVPLRFVREGIRYDDLDEDERDQWESLDWGDDADEPPDEVGADAVNKWLFNTDTVDRMLAHLMEHGETVAGGDRLGKTIIFAKNQRHAEFIEDRFNVLFPEHRGGFARIITHATEHADTLIEKFKIADSAPHIAISVDMLDTGVDVPEIVNLVFFKPVRSKIKFWQMLGRGTRLCPDLFGPGRDKTAFYIFDYCGNLEYFGEDPPTAEASAAQPLSQKLFLRRLELLAELDAADRSDADHELRGDIATLLCDAVASMPTDDFQVRPKLRAVERFRERDVWDRLGSDDIAEAASELSDLPTALAAEVEDAKRFDLLLLNAQLAVLRGDPSFVGLRDKVIAIASLLEEQSAIPMIKEQLALIEEIQTDAWWEDVTAAMLDRVRRKLRLLVPLIEKRKREPLYTNFADELGEATFVELAGLGGGLGAFEEFRRRALEFLRSHEDDIVIAKLRTNRPLTPLDIEALEAILAENGIGDEELIAQASEEADGLGLFIRSLVGLDRQAAESVFQDFIDARPLTAHQLQFVQMVIEYLCDNGVMPVERLYESPFTDISGGGPEALFPEADIESLVERLETVRRNAAAG